jgi:hypothetical protein
MGADQARGTLWELTCLLLLPAPQEELVYRLQHTAGLNPKAFQARYARAGPAYGAGFYPVEPLKPADNKMLQVADTFCCYVCCHFVD